MKDPLQQFAFMAWAPCATKVIMRKTVRGEEDTLALFDLSKGFSDMTDVKFVLAPGVLHAAVSPDGERVAALTRSELFVFRMSQFC